MGSRTFRWWHAVIIFVVANAASTLPAGFNGEEAFYNSFELPAVAPPDWLFAPMWFVLNVTSLMALSIVANAPERTSRRRAFLVLEAIGWVLFASFATLYFWLKSPVLGAADTVAGLLVGLGSLAYAARIDRRAALFILMRVLWLSLATYVSVYAALHNADPFFQAAGR
jgi:benzodiazapine receptor